MVSLCIQREGIVSNNEHRVHLDLSLECTEMHQCLKYLPSWSLPDHWNSGLTFCLLRRHSVHDFGCCCLGRRLMGLEGCMFSNWLAAESFCESHHWNTAEASSLIVLELLIPKSWNLDPGYPMGCWGGLFLLQPQRQLESLARKGNSEGNVTSKLTCLILVKCRHLSKASTLVQKPKLRVIEFYFSLLVQVICQTINE